MKLRFTLFFALSILFLASCKDKTPQEEVTTPVVEETVVVDTVQEEPVVEEYVEPEPEWPKRVIVQQDEWIYDIARREYGNIFAWRKIYEANQDKISDPNMIYPGQELILPE